MGFIDQQLELLREVINDGILPRESSLIEEQKEKIIEMVYQYHEMIGLPFDRTMIGAAIDKKFADELGVI